MMSSLYASNDENTNDHFDNDFCGGMRPRKDSDMDTVTSMVVSGDHPHFGGHGESTSPGTSRKRSQSEDGGNGGEVGDDEDVIETPSITTTSTSTVSPTTAVSPQQDEKGVEDVVETIPEPKNQLLSNMNERSEIDRGYKLEDLPVAMAVPFVEFLDDRAEEYSRLPMAEAKRVHASPRNDQTKTNRRGGLISVNVLKEHKNTRLGIRFTENDGILTITKITGLLEPSPLRSGDHVIRLDGHHVVGWTPTKAVHYLRDRVGFISIVARNVHGDSSRSEVAVYKSNPQEKLGISFAHDENDNDKKSKALVIQTLNVGGLLGGSRSVLQVGDVVESIQSTKACEMADPSDAISFIRNITGFVTIVTRRQENHDTSNGTVLDVQLPKSTDKSTQVAGGEQPSDEHTLVALEHDLLMPTAVAETHDEYTTPAFVSVMALKENHNVRLGIKLVATKGKIYVTSVSRDEGLLKSSPLQEGMQLLSINNISVEGMASAKEALLMLRSIVGSVHLMAYNPHGNPEFCEAMVFKSSENLSVGVSFKGSTGRQLKICTIRKDGLFSQSALNVGDKVISINGVSCRGKRPRDAVDIVRNATGIVTLLTKSKATTGVVICECHQ